MRTPVQKKLDIPRLMALGDLDVRRVAKENPELLAGDYFSSVEEFIESAQIYKETLKVNSCDPEVLSALRQKLPELGFDKLNSHLDLLLDEKERNEQSMAAAYYVLHTLTERLNSVYGVSRGRGSGTEEGRDAVLRGGVKPATLQEALERLDTWEANRKLRVLAVDDLGMVLNMITSILSPYYEVYGLIRASQVESFLDVVTPELFLLDIEMPEMNGYDLVPMIRAREEHKDTPIVFLTGNATRENVKTAITLGVCDFISKPVNREVLLEKIADKIVWKKAF